MVEYHHNDSTFITMIASCLKDREGSEVQTADGWLRTPPTPEHRGRTRYAWLCLH